MLKGLSYKIKNRLLVSAFIVMLVISYEFAVSKTIDMSNECNKIEQQITTAGDSPEQIKQLEKEKQHLYEMMGKEISNNELQQSLLSAVTNYCNDRGTTLEYFPKPIISNNGNLNLETNIFTVEGSFNKLLQFQYLLERKYKMGKIASVLYKAKRNYDTKKYTLIITIYIQNLIST